MGIEPTNGGTTIRCLNPLATVATALVIVASQVVLPSLLPGLGRDSYSSHNCRFQNAGFVAPGLAITPS